MLAQAASRSPYNNMEGEGEKELVEAHTMETTWSPHERMANRRDGNFLLTGLGAIRNRACCFFSPVRRYR